MFAGISTSGNTSGAYAFLRWCAALVLVVGALAGSAAATQEEVLVYIGVIPSSGQWNMIVEWDIPDDWTDKTSSGNHPIFYVDMVGEGIQCADPNELEPGKNGPSFRRISASGDTEATLNVIGGRKYDNATLDQNNTYELNCNLHNPNGPHHRAVGFIEGKSVTVTVRNESGNVTIGESVTVTVAKSPVNSEKPVSIWRDDRCAEYDAVEWRLPAGGTSSIVSTLTGNNETLCASVPADTPFCLVSNSGVSDPFHKTLTVTIGSKTKTDTFTTGKRQTGNSPPAAPTVAVYGDLQDERSSSAVLSWSPVPGAYTDLPQTSYGYDVVYSLGHTWYRAATCSLPHVAGDTGKVVCDYEACTYRLNALAPHQSYRFSVRVHGEGGTSGWADNVSLALGAPVTDLQATRTNATTIRVTWTDPTSDSDTSYHVTYHDGSVNRMADANEIIEVGGNGRRLDLTVDPHRAYRIGVRVATPDGDYAGRWSPWRDAAAVPPASLPQVSGLRRFWNGAYQGRLGARWSKLPGASGYHVTIARRKGGKHGPKSNHLVAMHHTGDWLMVTDRAKIQLCKGDWVRVGVRPLYEPDGKWVNDGSNTDQPDVAGPWRDTPRSPYWTIMNKHDPVAGNVYEGRNCD